RPKIHVPNLLVGAAAGSEVALECRLEASLSPLISWMRGDGLMLLNNLKYEMKETKHGYKTDMKIKIRNLVEDDFGSYECLAKNTLGEKEGFIRLYEIPPPTANPKVTPFYEVFLPRLREHIQCNNGQRKNSPALMDESQEFLSANTNLSADTDSDEEDEAMPRTPLNGTSTCGKFASLSTVCLSAFILWW
ncbi:lachesin, partial [Caerostris darwini]